MEHQIPTSSTKKHFAIICDIAANPDVLFKALKIALVVGTALNLINQGDALLKLDIQALSWFKLGLTYCVPFVVSTYTAISIKLEFRIGNIASVDATLQCSRCRQTEISLHKGDLIPQCPACGLKTRWRLTP